MNQEFFACLGKFMVSSLALGSRHVISVMVALGAITFSVLLNRI